jgi:hypothetical protein
MFSDNFRRGEGKGRERPARKPRRNLPILVGRRFSVNKTLPEGESIKPNWAAEPLLKSYERTAPPLGFRAKPIRFARRALKTCATA